MVNANNKINEKIASIVAKAMGGSFPVFLGDGISVFLNQNKLTSAKPQTRNIVAQAPVATILIKKSAFSTMKSSNDLAWMDRTEKFYLRATKALFAYKVSQIRAYEALVKVENYLQEYQELNLGLFAELLNSAQFLTVDTDQDTSGVFDLITTAISNSLSQIAYEDMIEDVLKIMKRNAFSADSQLTTWIVDPENTDNYMTGPGTGVIELTLFSSLNTTTDINSAPSPANFEVQDPYQILNIIEDDVEIAIEDALTGNIGILSSLIDGSFDTPIDTATIVSSAVELLGIGNLDGTIDVEVVRDRMRKFYVGKPIVSAPDGVHIYIRGNRTLQDFSGEEFSIIPPNSGDPDISIDETILQAEYYLFTNQKIDFSTYKKLRVFSDNSLAMKSVWGGKVSDTVHSFSNGSWTLRVNCTDNMSWLQWSRYMESPPINGQGVNGVLEDPLTPYVLKTDSTGEVITEGGLELIDENKTLLQSGLLSYDSGLLNGQVATEGNLLQGQYNDGGSLKGAKIIQHPNGFVYRWKDGIITATANVTNGDPSTQSAVSVKKYQQSYGLTATENVLNNLDIANILSLLIVGQPYNVETFIRQAEQAHNLTLEQGATNNLSSGSSLLAVLDVVRRQSSYFGDFRPYRMITMSNASIEQSIGGAFARSQSNKLVQDLQAKRARLEKNIRALGRTDADEIRNSILIRTLRLQIDDINLELKKQISLARNSGQLSSADILTSNFNLFGRNRVLPLTGNFTADHDITRAMTIVGAQRRIEDVRLNRDNNLFIVSDQYDENTDIRPFLLKLGSSNWKIFMGTYVSIYDKCAQASKFMNLEFHCNPEGHLEFRPPQWNKTPFSVLSALFKIQKETGRQVVPEFLEQMFETRTSSLRREIHSENIRIVLISLLLGQYPDSALIPGISVSGEKALNFFGVSLESGTQTTLGGTLNIGSLVEVGDQLVGQGLSIEASFSEDGDILNGDTETLLGEFDPLFQESVGALQKVQTVVGNASDNNPPARTVANKSILDSLRDDFRKNYGIDPGSGLTTGDNGSFSDKDFIFNLTEETGGVVRGQDLLNKLQQTISNRDKLVSILLRNEERQAELEQVESILSGEFTAQSESGTSGGDSFLDDLEDLGNRTLDAINTIEDILTGDATKGTLFDHLIEDDRRNLLGPGSGMRFVIQDHDIINCSFTETPPDFCRVDVFGTAPFIEEANNAAFENTLFWAGATDFDLWRQYGYTTAQSIQLPFSSDAELQSKPFAILELQLQRVKINRGSITVVGNEFYRPGDVVYIPSKGLLYYVKSVNHNFTYGSTFTTSLGLEFGHIPGTYLPSPLDIIGMQYTKNPTEGTIIVNRSQQGDDKYQPLRPNSALVFPPDQNITQDNIQVLLDYRDNQVRFTNMMINVGDYLVGDRLVLIRGFIKEETDANKQIVLDRMAAVRYLLENPAQVTQTNSSGLGDDLSNFLGGITTSLGVSPGSNKELSELILPNGQVVSPISKEKIAEQLVVLNKRGSTADDTSQIQCLNSELLGQQTLEDESVDQDQVDEIFPKGGPKQNSWNDIRDDLAQVYNIIEIGILDINRPISTEGSDSVDIGDLIS